MNLNTLTKTTQPKDKRLGRGHGSGRVKTSGRGTKGQKARGKIKFGFEGGQLPLIKRLPFKKGKSRNNPLRKNPIAVNLKYLNLLPDGTVVDKELLVSRGFVKKDDANKLGLKVLGEGELKISLTVKLPCSHRAEEKIKNAGGKVEAF